MKKIFYIVAALLFNTIITTAQNIPYGISNDTVQVAFAKVFYNTPPFINDSMKEMDTIVYTPFHVYYYKPINYDSLTSPILWGIHGQGGNGGSPISDLKAIADRRNALIVSATMQGSWEYCYTPGDTQISSNLIYFYFDWYPTVFKQIYQHVLKRENANSIPVYLIGFSAGGQCVSRYMLIRQGVPDSIPIKMAVSTNAYDYTFATTDTIASVVGKCPDTTYNNVAMYYPCGLAGNAWGAVTTSEFNCNEDIIQYYNENYDVLIGTADTVCGSLWPCDAAHGQNRYERAKNFYHFSDSDAVARGTTLKWKYGEVPGVGHDENLMYNTILAGDSMPLAERLLFETPYHSVPSLAPYADFATNTTVVTLPNTIVQFNNNSINAISYFWDFGDSTTSNLTNPSHKYLHADTFTVTLTAISGTNCENKLIKHHYIVVNSAVMIKEYDLSSYVNIYPNPASDNITIETTSVNKNEVISIY
ncbi:MAG: PKD domain-containing protein, partial [Bacteroidales bacterium]